MNKDEIKQLSAYARYDGIYLAIVWAASFACFLAMTWQSFLSQFSTILLLSTPFFVAYRLKIYREEGLGGAISFKRAYFYCVRVFFNGSFIFSFLQWLYMQFVDNGKLVRMVSTILSAPQYDALYASMGVSRDEFLTLVPDAFAPMTISVNSFLYGAFFGAMISLPIAAFMFRSVRSNQNLL